MENSNIPVKTSEEVGTSVPASPTLPPNWTLTRWKDEITGKHYLEIGFPDSTSNHNVLEIDFAEVDRPTEIRRQLRSRGADMVLGAEKGKKFVIDLLKYLPPFVHMKIALPGWSNTNFVLPMRTIGDGKGSLKLSSETAPKCTVKGVRGKFKQWQGDVASKGEYSSYIMFCILVALAAALRKFANLSEGAMFNLSGGSGAGKTTALKCGVSVFGDPENLADYNGTDLSLEELAAAHNDLLLAIDDTENGKRSDLTAMLDKVAHVLPSGRPRQHSRFFAGTTSSAKLRWRCTGLSTSPISIDEIYTKVNKERTDGQKVRLIDIPVETNGSNGIFDLLEGSARENETAVDNMLADLEGAIRENHGVVIARWIKHLADTKPKKEVSSHIEEFVRVVVPTGTAVEKRLARKFGLVYAAGTIASHAKIVPWSSASIFDAVEHCFSSARAAAFGSKLHLGVARSRLLGLLLDKTSTPLLKSGQVFSPQPPSLTMFKMNRKGKLITAISEKHLEHIAGSKAAGNKLLNDLFTSGAAIRGHGGKQTVQFTFKVSHTKGGSPKDWKPRFHAFDLAALKKHLSV